jgi:hypothetical protein
VTSSPLDLELRALCSTTSIALYSNAHPIPRRPRPPLAVDRVLGDPTVLRVAVRLVCTSRLSAQASYPTNITRTVGEHCSLTLPAAHEDRMEVEAARPDGAVDVLDLLTSAADGVAPPAAVLVSGVDDLAVDREPRRACRAIRPPTCTRILRSPPQQNMPWARRSVDGHSRLRSY